MLETKAHNQHRILSAWIIVCGLLYIFAYQFQLPFKADTFLYGMVVGLIPLTLFGGYLIFSKQVWLFLLMAASALIGMTYTTMPEEGRREAILFTFFAGTFILSLTNTSFVKTFTKWIYIISIIVVLSSILHFLVPNWFNSLMRPLLRRDAYDQLMWSFTVDDAFAGVAAYTPNTTFSAAIVFGYSFLNLIRKNDDPLVKSKGGNIVLLVLSLFSIILCSKRGVFVATLVAMVVLLFYLYRKRNFLLKFLGVALLFGVALFVLYQTNEFVEAFLNRFITDDFLTGRDSIYRSLMMDFAEGNIWIGKGTGATYSIAAKGAHNIYIQILYDHGVLFSLPYYLFLLYNYYVAFKNKCPLSIFVQTIFLVYGLSGNPLYSNMFMIIYIYYVLYATRMADISADAAEPPKTESRGKTLTPWKERGV